MPAMVLPLAECEKLCMENRQSAAASAWAMMQGKPDVVNMACAAGQTQHG